MLVLAALLTGAADARAQAPALDTARLAYACPDGAGCLAEWAFRAMVAGNLAGCDPFADDAAGHISVTLRRGSRGGFVGVATEHDTAGKSLGTREMTGRTCEGLTDSMAIVVSSWLMSIPRRKAVAPPGPPVALGGRRRAPCPVSAARVGM